MQALFQTIDNQDSEAFTQWLTADASFRFGNQPVVQGRDAIREYVQGFFASVQALSHQLERQWTTADGVVCHGQVTYTRHDSTQLTVPFCNVLNMTDGKVHEYLIFADTSALYGG